MSLACLIIQGGRRYTENGKKGCRVVTKCGPFVKDVELALESGTNFTIAVQNPLALLLICCEESRVLSDIMHEILATKPLPWHIIMYAGGVSPSDSRDVVFVICRAGPEVLRCEQVWLCAISVRQYNVLDKPPGGVSGMFGILLEDCFLGTRARRS